MAAAGAKAEAASSNAAADTDLPKAAIKRIVKEKLDALGEGNIQIQKDGVLALAESAKVLITFLTATANDICKEKKRQTISADDVFAALEDLDFGDLVAPLQVALDGAPSCCIAFGALPLCPALLLLLELLLQLAAAAAGAVCVAFLLARRRRWGKRLMRRRRAQRGLGSCAEQPAASPSPLTLPGPQRTPLPLSPHKQTAFRTAAKEKTAKRTEAAIKKRKEPEGGAAAGGSGGGGADDDADADGGGSDDEEEERQGGGSGGADDDGMDE